MDRVYSDNGKFAASLCYNSDMQPDDDPRKYPRLKDDELSESVKADIRARLQQGVTDIYGLAKEFSCSPSQIAGIKAAMTKGGS